MSVDRRTLFWRSVVCCLLLMLVRVAQTVPFHGSNQFLGYQYWQSRYSLGYNDDWPGFWNNDNNGRVQYNRANSEFSPGRPCGGCSCIDQTKTATCTGPTV